MLSRPLLSRRRTSAGRRAGTPRRTPSALGGNRALDDCRVCWLRLTRRHWLARRHWLPRRPRAGRRPRRLPARPRMLPARARLLTGRPGVAAWHSIAVTHGLPVAPVLRLGRCGPDWRLLTARPVASQLFSWPTGLDQIARTTCRARTGAAPRSGLGSRRAEREQLVSPDDHADDQHQQRQRCQPNRHVDQAEVTGHGPYCQQADRDRYDGHDCAEPDQLAAPLVVNRSQGRSRYRRSCWPASDGWYPPLCATGSGIPP
jgi:hypothetical protein